MSSRWWSRPAAVLGSIGLVGALVLAGAVPLAVASSSTKTYTLSVSPSSSGQFSATFTDTTPSASINSVTLTLPAGYSVSIPSTGEPCSTIASGSTPIVSNTSNNCSVSSSTDGSTITVTNLNPVSYQQTVTLTFTPTIPQSGLSCDDTWGSNAWTGSKPGSGAQFVSVSQTGYDYTLDTGSSTSVSSSTVAGVTVTNNGSSPASFGIGCGTTNHVSVAKPAGSTAKLNVTADVLWKSEPAVTPLGWTQVDTPASANNPKTGTHDIQWCNGTPSYDSSGNLISTADLTMPGIEVACLIKETSTNIGLVDGTQMVQVHDLILLTYDPIFSR